MTRKFAAALFMCAVLALVALVPLAAGGEITIVKGAQGPRASAKTWTYVPEDYGTWTAKLDNNGLRSLVIDVYDNTSGALELKLHQRIRFAAYNAYPSGIIYSEAVPMAKGGLYEITATPNGPRDSYVVVTDSFALPPPLDAKFSYQVVGHSVNVDASTSTGMISEYVWDWGDSSMMGTGVTATHEYAAPGTYNVVLTVSDMSGGSSSASQAVTLMNAPPVAAFTATLVGHSVSVDATASTDDWGITGYAWSFGDAGTATGPTATHAYMAAGTYTITLTVTDVASLTGTAMQDVVLPDNPPSAAFTISVSGLTVNVDATGSLDDWGIASYSWNFGDGATGTGMITSHTYSVPAGSASAPATSGVIINAEPPPYYVAGYTYDVNGGILTDCVVQVMNMRTGESGETLSSSTTGLYRFNLYSLASDFLPGDPIRVTATKGTLVGSTDATVPDPLGSYMTVHVTLLETGAQPFDVTITLTVTDTKGQTAVLSQTVTLYP